VKYERDAKTPERVFHSQKTIRDFTADNMSKMPGTRQRFTYRGAEGEYEKTRRSRQEGGRTGGRSRHGRAREKEQ